MAKSFSPWPSIIAGLGKRGGTGVRCINCK